MCVVCKSGDYTGAIDDDFGDLFMQCSKCATQGQKASTYDGAVKAWNGKMKRLAKEIKWKSQVANK